MVKVTGLGKGLGSLIPSKKASSAAISDNNRNFLIRHEKDAILQVPVELVATNPHQPRQIFDHEGLEELIESIKVHGIIQPLIVTKTTDGYELIAGERRLRAAKIIGLPTVPVIVREAKEQEKLELALIENVQRKNLNAIEKAVAYERLLDEFNLSQEVVAEKMGISRSAVSNSLRFLALPEEIQEALAREEITEGHAKVIAGLKSEAEQIALFKKIQQHNFSVRDTEQESKNFPSASAVRKARHITKDALLQEQEAMLRSKLNTKVSIDKKGKQGKISIEFYSDEELNAIINKIIE